MRTTITLEDDVARIAQALGQAPGWLDCEPTWIPVPLNGTANY